MAASVQALVIATVARNALFGRSPDHHWGSGLEEACVPCWPSRVEEAGSVPTPARDKQICLLLPDRTNQGATRARTIRIPASLLARLRSYLEVERSVAVDKFKTRSRSKRMPGAASRSASTAARSRLRRRKASARRCGWRPSRAGRAAPARACDVQAARP